MLSAFRPALRSLARARGLAVVAVLTLGVGIGATTAIFSALQALVIAPFSYPDSGRLVHLWSGNGWPLSPADAADMQRDAASFETFGVYQPQTYNIGAENAQTVLGVSGTWGVLQSLGIRPQLGRWFEPADEETGAAPVVILSHALWQQLLAGDPAAIGR